MNRYSSCCVLSCLLMLICGIMTSCMSDDKWNGITFCEVQKSEQFTEELDDDDDDDFAALHNDGEREFDVQVNMQFMQPSNDGNEEVCRLINAQIIEMLLNQSRKLPAEEAVEGYIKRVKSIFQRDQMSREYVDHIEGKAEYGFENVINYRMTQNVFSGGAHPSTMTTILRFNALTGDFISLDNVFPSSSHAALVDLLTAKLMRDNKVKTIEELHEKGYLEFMDMFVTTNFALRKDSIEFCYNEYDIAPYSNGSTTISLGYAAVEPLMNTIAEDDK